MSTAAAWQAHLVAGGTTSWQEFAGRDLAGDDGDVEGATTAGAQNLALLRRLNQAGHPSAELVAQVLSASLPGRGRPDLLIAGVDQPRWGARPVDPDTLPAAELLRVAVGLLADRVAAAELPAPENRRPRRWARQYELSGDPWLASGLNDVLIRDGRLPGGRAAHHVVLAGPVDRMLASLWSRRAHGDSIRGWEAWLEGWARRDALPDRIDVAALAQAAADRIGTDRTHVVLDSAVLPGLLGVRGRIVTPELPGAASADLARRIGAALRVRVPTEHRRELTWHVLRPALNGVGEPPVRVPDRFLDWLEARAESQIRRLRAGGYAVHGDLQALLPSEVGEREPPGNAAEMLARAIALLLTRRLPAPGERTTGEVEW